jgi:hypothetical protein
MLRGPRKHGTRQRRINLHNRRVSRNQTIRIGGQNRCVWHNLRVAIVGVVEFAESLFLTVGQDAQARRIGCDA